jgi:hypothetical protein
MTTTVSAGSIASRIDAVRARIRAAAERTNRDPASVTLVAVSKACTAETVAEAWRAGVTDFGENRVVQGAAKAAALAAMGIHPAWHLIGHLQTNKVRAALGSFAILHAVDSERLLRAITDAAESPVRIMIEVNVSGEATKYGVPPAGVAAMLACAEGLPEIRVEGLMTVAPLGAAPQEFRPIFRELRILAAAHGLPRLSMGMTDDFEIAIEEGSTHVRIGRAIFGERKA